MPIAALGAKACVAFFPNWPDVIAIKDRASIETPKGIKSWNLTIVNRCGSIL